MRSSSPEGITTVTGLHKSTHSSSILSEFSSIFELIFIFMAAASSSASGFFTNLALMPRHQPQRSPPFSHHLIIRPLLPSITIAKPRGGSVLVGCLISDVDGGGVSDDFVSTQKTGFGSEFSVIANMLKRIEPLDTSVISKGVSHSAKDSMKQTISTMLGLLPSDQFSVTVRVSKQPLDRLIVSSIVTG